MKNFITSSSYQAKICYGIFSCNTQKYHSVLVARRKDSHTTKPLYNGIQWNTTWYRKQTNLYCQEAYQRGRRRDRKEEVQRSIRKIWGGGDGHVYFLNCGQVSLVYKNENIICSLLYASYISVKLLRNQSNRNLMTNGHKVHEDVCTRTPVILEIGHSMRFQEKPQKQKRKCTETAMNPNNAQGIIGVPTELQL